MTRVINIGGVSVGGGNPIAIQSMTNTDTKDVKATLEQINMLYKNNTIIVKLMKSNLPKVVAMLILTCQ